MTYCAEMKLLSAEKSRSFIESSLVESCDVEFEEVASKKKWSAIVEECPKFDGQAQVYIRYSCVKGWGKSFDNIEIFRDGICESDPLNNDIIINRRLKSSIKPGMSLSSLKSLGLVFLKKNESSEWVYHSHPGISVNVVTMNNKCVGKECDDESFLKIKETYIRHEFVNFLDQSKYGMPFK